MYNILISTIFLYIMYIMDKHVCTVFIMHATYMMHVSHYLYLVTHEPQRGVIMCHILIT